jgi:hypothetical protein
VQGALPREADNQYGGDQSADTRGSHFPNETSCLRLVSALTMEANEEWMERKYLNMDAVEMTWYETPVIVPHYLENAPRFPHFHSTTISAS